MQIRLGTLKKTVRELLETYRKTGVRDTRPAWEKEPAAYDKPEAGKGSLEMGRTLAAQDLQDEIDGLRTMPEFASLDAFMSSKLDNDETSYDWKDLQALARN